MRLERNIARHPLFQVTKVWFDFFFCSPLCFFFWSFQPPSFFLVRGDGVSGVDNISGCRIKKHAVNPVDASAHGVNVVMNKCRWLTSTNHPWRINGSFLNPVITNRQCLSSPEGEKFLFHGLGTVTRSSSSSILVEKSHLLFWGFSFRRKKNGTICLALDGGGGVIGRDGRKTCGLRGPEKRRSCPLLRV